MDQPVCFIIIALVSVLRFWTAAFNPVGPSVELHFAAMTMWALTPEVMVIFAFWRNYSNSLSVVIYTVRKGSVPTPNQNAFPRKHRQSFCFFPSFRFGLWWLYFVKHPLFGQEKIRQVTNPVQVISFRLILKRNAQQIHKHRPTSFQTASIFNPSKNSWQNETLTFGNRHKHPHKETTRQGGCDAVTTLF